VKYLYRCTECGIEQQVVKGMKDDPPYCCYCGGKLERADWSCNFTLKGPGWARDGYEH